VLCRGWGRSEFDYGFEAVKIGLQGVFKLFIKEQLLRK
jgi:hypothetical protein